MEEFKTQKFRTGVARDFRLKQEHFHDCPTGCWWVEAIWYLKSVFGSQV